MPPVVRRPGHHAPLLPADDPLSLLRNISAYHRRTIGIWCEADNCIYMVDAIINPQIPTSAIPEALATSLRLQQLPTPPTMVPGYYAVVPVVHALESCGIPDMEFRLRVIRSQEQVIYLGRNALEKAAGLRVG